jgi:hypothetical protein
VSKLLPQLSKTNVPLYGALKAYQFSGATGHPTPVSICNQWRWEHGINQSEKS